MQKASQQYRDISTARIIFFADTVVFINHPQAIQKILTNDRNKFFVVAEANKIPKPLVGDYSSISNRLLTLSVRISWSATKANSASRFYPCSIQYY